MHSILLLQALLSCFIFPLLALAQAVNTDVSQVIETRLVTLTELETFRQTIYPQYTNLKSTIEASTLITVTASSSTSVITYSYEVGPGSIGWALPSLSNGDLLPPQPTYLPGALTSPSLAGASTGTSTGSSTGSLNTASSSIASSKSGLTTSTSSVYITGTITSFPSDFTAEELPRTTYTTNGWITTTDSGHHTTIIPLIVIPGGGGGGGGLGGGRGIILWNLPAIPNVEFIFPKFPKFPSLPKIHFPCIKFFGIKTGDCPDPPSSDGSDNQSTNSQPTNSQPTNNKPTNSQPANSQNAESKSTTSHSSSKSTTSSNSPCSITSTASNCMVYCANTASGSCTSYTTTCSQTVTGCSVSGKTITTSIAACSVKPTPIPPSYLSSLSSKLSSQSSRLFATQCTGGCKTAQPTTVVISSQTLPTTFKTVTTTINSDGSGSSMSASKTGSSSGSHSTLPPTPTILSFSVASSPPITSCSMVKVGAFTIDSYSYAPTSKCTCNDGWGAGIGTTVGPDKSTTYTCQIGTSLTIAVSTAAAPPPTTTPTLPPTPTIPAPTPLASCHTQWKAVLDSFDIYGYDWDESKLDAGGGYFDGIGLLTQLRGCSAVTRWKFENLTISDTQPYQWHASGQTTVFQKSCIEHAMLSAGAPSDSCSGSS